jgi:hypothetical protein
MAGINGKPAGMRQPRTRMGGLYCIRLCNQVEVRNLYAYAVVALVDMITIVARIKSFQNVKSCDIIDKEKGKKGKNAGERRSEPGFAPAELIATRQNQRSVADRGPGSIRRVSRHRLHFYFYTGF